MFRKRRRILRCFQSCMTLTCYNDFSCKRRIFVVGTQAKGNKKTRKIKKKLENLLNLWYYSAINELVGV